MQKFYEISGSQKPRHFERFKKPVQMEILGSKMRASQGKRTCMIVLIQWFQECALQIPRDPWIHFCYGYFKVYLFFLKLKNNVLLKIMQNCCNW